MNAVTPFIGIDFGTSKSCMAWYDSKSGQTSIIRNAEGEEKTPSVVYFGPTETLVGTYAENILVDVDEAEHWRVICSAKPNIASESLIAVDGRRVAAVEVAAEVLRKLKLDAQEGLFLGQEVPRAVVTCPAAFDALQRDKIKEAGRIAGFSEVVLLAEPVAAALAYAQEGMSIGNHVLIYDLGAGTFDLAVLERTENDSFRLAMEPKGIARCGGDDFDKALYDYCFMAAHRKLESLMLTDTLDLAFLRRCRKGKETLSALESWKFSILLRGADRRETYKETISRTIFEGLIEAGVAETVRLTKALFEEASARGAVDSVLLIGGSSRVPLVQRLLQDALPVKLRKWQHSDLAVALGAAYYAQSLWGTPVSPHALVAPATGQPATPPTLAVASTAEQQAVSPPQKQAQPTKSIADARRQLSALKGKLDALSESFVQDCVREVQVYTELDVLSLKGCFTSATTRYVQNVQRDVQSAVSGVQPDVKVPPFQPRASGEGPAVVYSGNWSDWIDGGLVGGIVGGALALAGIAAFLTGRGTLGSGLFGTGLNAKDEVAKWIDSSKRSPRRIDQRQTLKVAEQAARKLAPLLKQAAEQYIADVDRLLVNSANARS